MKSQSQDILAKLLATENLAVVRANVATASFDIINRVLTLPKWKQLTPEVEEMLILHEVGHALYTTPEGYGVMVYEEKPHLRGYCNILEDVRIEKKMKERYPGSRKTFNAGYTELNRQDFFGVNDRDDLSELLLIDRINLFYKVGYSAGIPFTAEEYVYVQKANQTFSEEDVVTLAEEIFNFTKQQIEEQEDEEESRKIVLDGDGGDSIGELGDEELEPETMDNFDSALNKLRDVNSRTYYYDAEFEVESKHDRIISHKQVLQELTERYEPDYIARMKVASASFKASTTNIVNYLVKEFEMRKSASAYKRTKISRLGQLDSRKLYAYKIKEDLFKQVATVQEGKKHGMIFLLDWSGSMQSYMNETVEQVINLATFCQKIRIPYQVLAFTDGYGNDEEMNSMNTPKVNANGLDDMRSFNLLELYSDKMNIRDFNRMTDILLHAPWFRSGKYGLNGTPLNQSLLYMVNYIGKFIRVNDVEKMNLIVLTDGESNTLHHYGHESGVHGIKSGNCYISENGIHKNVNATSILRDKVTRKEYEITDVSGQQTGVLLKLLKDRYGVRTVGFYVLSNTLRNMERFVKYNMDVEMKASVRTQVAVELQSKMRRDKAIVLKTVPGRDEMYLLSASNKIVDEDLEVVTQDMSAAQISKQLSRVFNSRKGSRVVLSSFIGVVA